MGPCPNGTCPHASGVHDIYELGDPYPTCCAGGCGCGRPGRAVIQKLDFGRTKGTVSA
jgi:hypothetical protein